MQQDVRRLLHTTLEDGGFLRPGGAQLGGVWNELLCELAGGEDSAVGELERSAALGERIGECLHDLGLLCWDRDELGEAKRLLEQVLAIGEETLGSNHPDVAAALNSLGALYLRQGRLIDAAAAFRRSLAIVEEALGSNHPQVAIVLVNLASVLGDQGEHDEAIALGERAIRLNEQLLGPDHPGVIQSRNILATLYTDCGRFAEAEALLRSVRWAQEEAGGRSRRRLGSAPFRPGS